MLKLYFVSSNIHKFQEIQKMSSESGIQILFHQAELPEIQSDSLEEIALFSAKQAYAQLRQPLFVEDTGLFISELHGFPGPYASYVFRTLGNQGILKLLGSNPARSAVFKTAIALVLSNDESHTFVGETKGSIAEQERGSKGWGYDPIFIPNEMPDQTYAQLGSSRKNQISHRRRSVNKLIHWMEEYNLAA